jgi:hypothetical protein
MVYVVDNGTRSGLLSTLRDTVSERPRNAQQVDKRRRAPYRNHSSTLQADVRLTILLVDIARLRGVTPRESTVALLSA